jgi:hypothetical protein
MTLDAVRFETVSQGRLTTFGSWPGSTGGELRLQAFGKDAFGKLVDRNAFHPWTLESEASWQLGTHTRTTMARTATQAGELPKPTVLTLDGPSLGIGNSAQGAWVSAWHRPPVRCEAEFVSWDIEDAVDREFAALRRFTIELRGRTGNAVGAWFDSTIVIPGTPDPYLERGGPLRDPADPTTEAVITAEEFQIRITLTAVHPLIPVPATVEDLLQAYPSVRSLRVYFRIGEPRYVWKSFGDLGMDCQLPFVHSQRRMLLGSIDYAWLDLQEAFQLAGAFQERMALSWTGPVGRMLSIRALAVGYSETSREGP